MFMDLSDFYSACAPQGFSLWGVYFCVVPALNCHLIVIDSTPTKSKIVVNSL